MKKYARSTDDQMHRRPAARRHRRTVRRPVREAHVQRADKANRRRPAQIHARLARLRGRKITPETVRPLDEAEAEDQSRAAEQKSKEKIFTGFIAGFRSKWRSRTYLRLGLHDRKNCSNFKGNAKTKKPSRGLPRSEAEKTDDEEACPAPVPQIKPALPGTVSPLEPRRQKARPAARSGGARRGSPASASGSARAGSSRRSAREPPRRIRSAVRCPNRWRARERDLLHPRAADPRLARQPDRRGRSRARVRRPRPRRGPLGRLDRRVRGGRAARRRRRLGGQGRLRARSPTSTARSPRR